MKSVLIVGNGIVGHNMRKELAVLKPDVYDKYTTTENTKSERRYDVAFICVPTPYNSKSDPCGIQEVEAALNETDAELYIIKSTVLPGTTDRLKEKTGKRIVFSPEYYGATHFTNGYEYNFTILGGAPDDSGAIIQLLQNVYDGRHRFCKIKAVEAELVKYMENAFLAMKVSFCTQFWEIANKIGADYNAVREAFVLDPRVNPSQTYVFEEHPYWESKCYDKDIPAIAETYGAEFLLDMIDYNKKMKRRYKK